MRQTITQLRGTTGVFGKAGLAEGTGANTYKTVNAVDVAIDGVFGVRVAAADNIAMTAAAVQAAGTKCLYLVQANAAGTLSTKKGTEQLTTDLTVGNRTLSYPEPDSDKAAIGAFKVATVAVTFTAGTTDFSAAGVTVTAQDFALGGPMRPIV